MKTFLGGFRIHNSLSKVEKCQNILRITKLENVEKVHWAHVLEAQMVSIRRMALLFCSTHSLDILLPCPNWFWGANIASKTFEMALKSKIHFQKLKKVRIFYPFPRLKMLKNILSSRLRGANGFNSSYGLDFFFHTLSRCSTTLKKLIWGTKAVSKTF